MSISVAIQGERGSFSHQAAIETLGREIELLPLANFERVFAAVSEGRADRAVVPIENTLAGSIHENYDRLRAGSLSILAETQLRIRHCLIARPGATLDQIRKIASHPVALEQCRLFLSRVRDVEAVAAYDTAGAVMQLMESGAPSQAAIASELAASLYGAVVLQREIEDDPQNFTRFLVLSKTTGPIERAGKASIVFMLEHVPGALYHALGAFANRNVDLTKIESRPLRGRPWEYAFYLDVLGDPNGAAGEAVADLKRMTREMRILGWYPEGLSRRAENAVSSSAPQP